MLLDDVGDCISGTDEPTHSSHLERRRIAFCINKCNSQVEYKSQVGCLREYVISAIMNHSIFSIDGWMYYLLNRGVSIDFPLLLDIIHVIIDVLSHIHFRSW